MLLPMLCIAIEKGLNQLISLDTVALQRLAALEGAVLQINCRTPNFSLFLHPNKEGLHLSLEPSRIIDCTLTASTIQLLGLVLSSDKARILHSQGVDLSGNSGLLLELSTILDSLELDWEYELSRWIGPLGAGTLGSQVRAGIDWGNASAAQIRHTLADFLSEESATLIGIREAEVRFAELDALKLSLDRLEARIQQLAQGSKSL